MNFVLKSEQLTFNGPSLSLYNLLQFHHIHNALILRVLGNDEQNFQNRLPVKL